VENPARTSRYLSEREARLGALRAELAELFRGRERECEQGGVVLEIGCGHGHFLTAYAAAHPEKFCVGFDIEIDRIERAGRKRRRAELEKNLAFVRAEATEFFAALPAHARFSEVFVLFPDPWPKRRHHKNRMIRPESLSALAARAAKLRFFTEQR
jgi:tRNA (guanine-N7-)-methyltransferase